MAALRRGYRQERHPLLKGGLAAAALGGFALAWWGFAAGHSPRTEEPPVAQGAAAATASPPTAPASPAAMATSATPPSPAPAATPTRARTSRGS